MMIGRNGRWSRTWLLLSMASSMAVSGAGCIGGSGPGTGGLAASGGAPDVSGGTPGTTGGNAQPATGGSPMEKPTEPGVAVELARSAETQAEVARIEGLLSAASDLSLAEFQSRYTPTFSTDLGYDPKKAEFLDLIQASALSLDEAELATLAEHGFVISARKSFPHFAYGYQSIYGEDLPLYVSADSVLDAVHRSYDDILKGIEERALVPGLRQLLTVLRDQLELADGVGDALHADLDVYLTVALSLLDDNLIVPSDFTRLDEAKALFDGAKAAEGSKGVSLFGVPRDVDFSQFTPRGHYTESEPLKRYFRASMWLGRIDFRMVETQGDGSQVFHRRQFDAAATVALLMEGTGFELYGAIDGILKAFVGESDYMVPSEMNDLLGQLGISDIGSIEKPSDTEVAQAIAVGGYGEQRIASHIIRRSKPDDGKPLPLNRSFAILGQRYAVDSHVFSNVVYDRTAEKRMMPNPMDVAFAALSNDQASMLLAEDLTKYSYQGNLAQTRIMVDEHGADYWDENLYTGWLGSLRTLSTHADADVAQQAGLPAVTKTDAWGRRLLNTQLASWAQLRHDTILYVKQSYTGGIACEFPDGYVDPYPEFFAQLGRYANQGLDAAALVEGLGEAAFADQMTDYFQQMRDVMGVLQEMAEYERAGTPFTDAHLAFINDAVVSMAEGCGWPTSYTGWYARLLFDIYPESDPTIADVHTQPTDKAGTEVGRVLHVGTGDARLMVVTVDTCAGPRAYAGLASSYYEVVTENYERLTDEIWKERVRTTADVPWMAGPLVSAVPSP